MTPASGHDLIDPWVTLRALATDDPVFITAITPLGEDGVEVPPAVLELFPNRLDFGDARDRDWSGGGFSMATAWMQARDIGAGCGHVTFPELADRYFDVTIVNMAEEFDVFVSIIIEGAAPVDDGSAEREEVARTRRMRQVLDAKAQFISFDQASAETFGLNESHIGHATLFLLHPDDVERAIGGWMELMSDPGGTHDIRLRYRRADGDFMWVEATLENRLEEDGTVIRDVRDVTSEVEAISSARDRDEVLATLAEALPSAIAEMNGDGTIVFHNERFAEIVGLGVGDGLRDIAFQVTEPAPDVVLAFLEAAAPNEGFTGDLTLDGPLGERRCHASYQTIVGDDAETKSIIICLEDITERWVLEQKLQVQATHDGLTGVANRTALVSILDGTLEAARHSGAITAVMYFDLIDFKRVNDKHGHGVGDELLRQVSNALQRETRQHDVVGRQGGDEFLVVCRELDSIEQARMLAHRLQNAVNGRWVISGNMIETSATCGVSVDVGGRLTAERLIAEADLAMYEQKREGLFEPGLFREEMFADQRLELSRDDALRTAATDGSLEAHFQPFVDLDARLTTGFEALMRWNFDDSLVYPDGFIPLAERRGIIVDLGRWMFEEVCRQAAELRTTDEFFFSINVSPVQLRDVELAATLDDILRRYDIRPSCLGLELTEGVMIAETPQTRKLLNDLADLGVMLIVDDFGTGFASLDYLRTLPVGGLKIDRGFVNDVAERRTNAIIANIIELTRRLDLWLVAEGIETEEQAERLAEMGVELGQGYHFARPARMETFEQSLRRRQPS